jgi:uncharacterized repeat protein (TIGR03803 family)
MNTKTNSKNHLLWVEIKKRLVAIAMLPFLSWLAPGSSGQTYTILHAFGTNVMGLYPQAPLVQADDGTLYGTTVFGGAADQGQVFKVNPDGSGYVVIKNFSGLTDGTNSDGAVPFAGLLLSGNTLYGTANQGGNYGCGTVFAVNTDGSDFTVLHHFTAPDPVTYTNSDGTYSWGALILSGKTLYGTATGGGNYGNGTVFAINTDGSGFTNIYNFTATDPNNDTNSDGANPQAGLILSGNTLYGTAPNGGCFGVGTVFSLKVDGSCFTNLHDFSARALNFNTNSDGAYPWSSLVLSGNTLYGTAALGGDYNGGTLFAVNTDGSSFHLLHIFTATDSETGANIDGATPPAALILSGGTLYGTAYQGGTWGCGTVFSVNTDGTDFVVMHHFTGGNDGANPLAALVLSGSSLYGTAWDCGSNGYGAVFRIATDGGGFSVILDFVGGDGAQPQGVLVSTGTNFYGTTSEGGASGNGTVFSINPDGGGYSVLYSFSRDLGGTNQDGVAPEAGLVLSGRTLYGTTFSGGNFGCGTLFAINTDGSGFTNLHSFTATVANTNCDGANPQAGLILFGNTLFGTTDDGGSFGLGTVFAVNTDGSSYTVLHSFSGNDEDGAYPAAGLVLCGSTLYGTATCGAGDGGVFKVDTDGSGYGMVKAFSGEDGGIPYSDLTLSGTTLYGTTEIGPVGVSSNWDGDGTVFALNTEDSRYSILYSFSNTGWNGSLETNADGAYPYAGLVSSGVRLYGTTSSGGNDGFGTLFAVNTDGSSFVVLKSFAGSDGANPCADLFLSGSTLYGTTSCGGSLGNGVLFSLALAPSVATSPQTQTAYLGSTVDLITHAVGDSPLYYLYYANGTNLVCCSTNSILELTNVQIASIGSYTVVITNSFGAVTSSPAVLNVIPAVEQRPAVAIPLMGDIGASLNVEYTANLTSPVIWQPLETVNLTSPLQYCFDASSPLPPQRFYRAWQSGTPVLLPSLGQPVIVPAINVSGNVGDTLELDYINQMGPTNGWVKLATVTLTNTSELYFDFTAPEKPARLYQIVPMQ